VQTMIVVFVAHLAGQFNSVLDGITALVTGLL
jgi:hypothetical protein